MSTAYSNSETETVQSPQPPATKRLKQSAFMFSVITSSCDAASSNSSTVIPSDADCKASPSSNLDQMKLLRQVGYVLTRNVLDNVFIANTLTLIMQHRLAHQ